MTAAARTPTAVLAAAAVRKHLAQFIRGVHPDFFAARRPEAGRANAESLQVVNAVVDALDRAAAAAAGDGSGGGGSIGDTAAAAGALLAGDTDVGFYAAGDVHGARRAFRLSLHGSPAFAAVSPSAAAAPAPLPPMAVTPLALRTLPPRARDELRCALAARSLVALFSAVGVTLDPAPVDELETRIRETLGVRGPRRPAGAAAGSAAGSAAAEGSAAAAGVRFGELMRRSAPATDAAIRRGPPAPAASDAAPNDSAAAAVHRARRRLVFFHASVGRARAEAAADRIAAAIDRARRSAGCTLVAVMVHDLAAPPGPAAGPVVAEDLAARMCVAGTFVFVPIDARESELAAFMAAHGAAAMRALRDAANSTDARQRAGQAAADGHDAQAQQAAQRSDKIGNEQ
ncbi:hypothetical protein HK105_208533 [Polyrhizophydium stewartii]|uniref:DUF4460 domain-containing protein n=1 Tax=Polyrhizophydium stewartii TaxID=2732419 RepID=A0ABR4MXQ5_9FUNG